MGGVGGDRGGGYDGGGGGMPDREEMERMRAAMEAAVRAPERLIIVKADPGLVVTDEEGSVPDHPTCRLATCRPADSLTTRPRR
jgi:hypothetical protein